MTEKRKKLPEITTPAGTFKYPKLKEPDFGTKDYPKPDGEWSVRLVLDAKSDEAKALIKALKPYHEEAISEAKEAFAKLPVATRKKLKDVTVNDFYTEVYDKETEKPTGEIEFKAAAPFRVTPKQGPRAGKTVERYPIIFDAQGQRIKDVPEIWGGTTGRLRVALSPYFIPGSGAAGLKLRLVGVQIIDLVSGGDRSADSLGFDAVEGGYSHTPKSDFEDGADSVDASADDEDDGAGNF